MPGRAVNTIAIVGAGDDNSIITENGRVAMFHPLLAEGALARTGVSDEQVAATVGGGQSAGVEFDSGAARETVHGREFVERVLQGIIRSQFGQQLAVQQDAPAIEAG